MNVLPWLGGQLKDLASSAVAMAFLAMGALVWAVLIDLERSQDLPFLTYMFYTLVGVAFIIVGMAIVENHARAKERLKTMDLIIGVAVDQVRAKTISDAMSIAMRTALNSKPGSPPPAPAPTPATEEQPQ